jgi:hypothetical protein
MKKLELKHLAPYLPYGLKCHIMGEHTEESEYTDNPVPESFTLFGLLNKKVSVISKRGKDIHFISDCFPILRPLSDITKEIEVYGESLSQPLKYGVAQKRKKLTLRFMGKFRDIGIYA